MELGEKKKIKNKRQLHFILALRERKPLKTAATQSHCLFVSRRLPTCWRALACHRCTGYNIEREPKKSTFP